MGLPNALPFSCRERAAEPSPKIAPISRAEGDRTACACRAAGFDIYSLLADSICSDESCVMVPYYFLHHRPKALPSR
jgi:hypothetical protein